ncbi:hypothetical protein HYH03_008732 [Edaphochlamys debaryana]|uniref:Bardet-Biedl syndrome 7 protein homolog n=1 Tax=Edaphochlamys debaryana TaxID=47281 RepID=A0A835Y8N6_9CHLO|nr:hypothetical protein HYH03_008732 [Edaphochlamys debaryana]|eukprot:KAG2493069.1 hypothetical protein HYH03_008732 [Edaphochlamys debaryana]
MELELFRQDLIQTSTCAAGTMAVMPLTEEKKTQKVAAGDLSGVIQCFSVKKGDFQVAFKTLPSKENKVTSLVLGKGKTQRDKIFLAAGSQIKGVNKKGKEFFRFNTQLTETIRRVDIFEKNIWSAGEYVHNHFIEGRDKALYLCPDRINDATVVPLAGPTELWPVLACQDRYVRVLRGSAVCYEAPTPAAPVSLQYVPESHDPQHRFPQAKEVLYGTDVGTLVQLLLEPEAARQGFTLPNPKKQGAVATVYSGIDFTKTGMNNIVVGREDGGVEVLDLEEAGQLTSVYSVKLTESINALDGGFVTGLLAQEFVLHSFSGKIISYAPPGGGLLAPPPEAPSRGPLGLRKAAPPPAAPLPGAEEEERRASYARQIERLRQEISALRQEIEAERTRFQARGGDTAQLAMSAPFTVQDKCKLEADEACYVLTIESAVPIFTVAIQSNAVLQMLDVPTNVAILSRSPPDESNGNLTLATYRCQDSTNRLAVKFKVREGRPSSLSAFVIPAISPKACLVVRHTIKPLCLHSRITAMDADRPTNELLITGSFSAGDVHGWITGVLHDLPPSLPPGQDGATYYFTNSLLGTQLMIKYRAGEARFLSDLVSTLGILHEHCMREATNAKQRVTVSFNPSAQSLQHSVALVWPQLEKQRTLKKTYMMLEGLQELRMQDGDVSYLSPEYRSVLDRADKIRQEYKEQPQHLDHLVALIKDLYLDFCKLTGVATPKTRIPALDQLLLDPGSSLEDLMEFLTGQRGVWALDPGRGVEPEAEEEAPSGGGSQGSRWPLGQATVREAEREV